LGELLGYYLADLMELLSVDWTAALWADLKDRQSAWKTVVVWVVWMVERMAYLTASLLVDVLADLRVVLMAVY
jgi:hypothetical protein